MSGSEPPHGGRVRRIAIVSLVIWVSALVATGLVPSLLPATALMAIVPAVLAVPVLPGRSIARVLSGSVLASLALLGLAAARGVEGDLLPAWLVDVLVTMTAPGLVGAVLLVGLHNQQVLAAENLVLRQSRAAVAAAADRERARIERDLHDGAQQRLHGALVLIALGRRMLSTNAAQAAASLQEASEQLRSASTELLELIRELQPAGLAEGGLTAGLQRLVARRTGVDLHVGHVRRYGPTIESAVWFSCLEALANVDRHAPSATCIVVCLAEQDGVLAFEIADNGPGFAADARPPAGGIRNMTERLRSLGGELRVESSGTGTRVIGAIPVEDVRAP